MTIRYTLSRMENVESFLRGIANSPRFAGTILLYCLSVGIVPIVVTGPGLLHLTIRDLEGLFAWAFGAFCLLTVWLFLRAKNAERTLTTSASGISTQIGPINGQVPWSKVGVVSDTRRFVLIAGRSGNAFCIPARAFENPEERKQFLTEIDQWRTIRL
jgi:hypothetical protein